MPKFFVFSDCHGFYDELIKALKKAKYNKNNPNHFLVGCGDYWDRGQQNREVMNYLNSIPDSNKVLVKGNHEILIAQAIKRRYPFWNDHPNGTFNTVLELANLAGDVDFAASCDKIKDEVETWISKMPNYFETENYVFCHSSIPYILKQEWRKASNKDWEKAMWGNPFLESNNFYNDKTIVFGHFHCSFAWNLKKAREIIQKLKDEKRDPIFDYESPEENEDGEFGKNAIFDPYYGTGALGTKYIGIDACTAHTHKVNVIVLEDDFLK